MNTLISDIQTAVSRRSLLDHPFYQQWNAGTLSKEALCEYAKQYFHYSLAFPTFLSAIHAGSDDIAVRQAVLENLIEEERGPENHPELWLRFCESLGLTRDEVLSSKMNESTADLIATIRGLARKSVHEGLAAMFAYESQVPAVAKAKIEGLRAFYGIDAPRDISFFTVHLEADVFHAQTGENLLTQLCDSDDKQSQALAASEATLGALYGFLDAVTPVQCAA